MVAIKWGRGMSNAVDHRITSGTLVIESKGLLPFAFNTFKENKNKFVIFFKKKAEGTKARAPVRDWVRPPEPDIPSRPRILFFIIIILFCSFPLWIWNPPTHRVQFPHSTTQDDTGFRTGLVVSAYKVRLLPNSKKKWCHYWLLSYF